MTRSAIAAVCAALLLPVATAEAKAPPKGRYDCTISGISFGSVTIQGANRYKRNGKTGKFNAKGGRVTFPDKRKGYKISFRTGGFKGFKGRWYKATDSSPAGFTYEIALENPESDDGFESIYCDRV